MSTNMFRVAVKHPTFNIFGLSSPLGFYECLDYCSLGKVRMNMPLHIEQMVSRMEVHIYDNLKDFSPVDAEPQYSKYETKNISELNIFRPINKIKEIIIPNYEVNDLLGMIIAKQSPKQAEIREKKRKEWRKFQRDLEAGAIIQSEQIINETNIVAQIVCEV